LTALSRTMDADRLNDVANHPDVFPWLGFLGQPGDLDLSPVIENPANFALDCEHGGYVLINQGGGQYEAHTMFLPTGRAVAHAAAVEGFRYLFTATDCQRVVTKVPAGNVHAAAHAKRCGFEELFTRAAVWPGQAGPEDVSYQELTLDRWLACDPETLAKGQWFHGELEAAKIAAGSIREVHEDDEAHDRAVGAAVLMFQAGNASKAAWHYNRWAALAGFAPLSVVSLTPLVVDVVDAVIEVTRAGMEVLKCR
jgi:hypothetical protein